MTTAEVLAQLKTLEEKATPGPWRPEREPVASNFWFDALPPRSTPIESTGTAFALGVAVAASPEPFDAALIAAARNYLPALIRIAEAADAVKRQGLLIDDGSPEVYAFRVALADLAKVGVK